MFKSGIIDPTKVTRLALQNAASVAGTVLLTEAVISNIPEENSNPVPGMNPNCLLYTSPSPRDRQKSRMPSSA